MALLGMPPEIFQRIIASYVHTVGVCKAWERRTACKTFAAFISEECFGRQPMTKYAHPTAKKLFLRHLGLFLGYRIKAPYGAPTMLPTLIRNVVDQFMTVTSQTLDTIRAAYTEQACNAIRHCCHDAFNLATKPSLRTRNKVAGDLIETHCLVIAIWMKDEKLITHYLSHGVSVWEKTRAFRPPIAVAVELKAVNLLPQLLEHAKRDSVKATKEKQTTTLDYIITLATESGQWETAITLTDWWMQHCRKPQPAQIVAWINTAVGAHATKFLHQMLDHDLTLATKTLLVERLYDLNDVWGTGGRCSLAEAMIDRRLLDITKFYSHAWAFSGSVLALAVNLPDIELVKRCLELGMSPDGLRNEEDDFEYPLSKAVCMCDVAMVDLLLDYGANPYPGQNIISKGLCDPGNYVRKVEALIRKAVNVKKSMAITSAW